MYSIDINFLNDRESQKQAPGVTGGGEGGGLLTGILPLVLGVLIGGGSFAGVFFWGNALTAKKLELEQTQKDLTTQLAGLDKQLERAKQIEAEVGVIEAEAAALAGVFTQVKPWSALMQEISSLVPPNVQLESITQSEKKITLAGTARSYTDVNDFVLLVQRSKFFKASETRVVNVQRVNFAGPVEFELPPAFDPKLPPPSPQFRVGQVISYRIETAETDASAIELEPELRRYNSRGLLLRLQQLRETGVIPK